MNKILQLFDEDFVRQYFDRELLSLYPDFLEIVSVKIKPYKKLIWQTTYHVVIAFEVEFLTKNKDREALFLVCSAHSEEPRENVFQVLTFLREQGLANDWIDIPAPLFFSPEFKGVFYTGLKGENILRQVRAGGDIAAAKIALVAKLFAALHSLDVKRAPEFNPQSAKIATVIPGVEAILREMSSRYNGVYDEDLRKFYDYFISKEEGFFKAEKNLVLIHGDAHLENIIDTGPERLGIIDFADLCRGDFARDLGTFLQQLEYRATSIKTGLRNPEENARFKKIFLEEYIKARDLVLDDNLKARIKLYYDWTMLRTATYFFLKAEVELERAELLFAKVRDNLKTEDFIF
ncbi:phosphotransferase [Patescibacteria group bacterium]|nr:phosphotransferase [Patescibacteria group bacterium]